MARRGPPLAHRRPAQGHAPYTAPTAIRAPCAPATTCHVHVARVARCWAPSASLSTPPLRRPLCSLPSAASRPTQRQPARPQAWRWYREVVGDDRRPVVRFAASCCLPFLLALARGSPRGEPTVERCRASRHRRGAPRRAPPDAGRHVVADRDGRDPDRADDGAGAGPHKPGAAMTPVAGCVPALLDATTGAEIPEGGYC